MGITDIMPTPDNYGLFVDLIKKASRQNIPHGCRTSYICGLTDKTKKHIPNATYLVVTLDRTLSYKGHIPKLNYKTSARNNILRKLSNTQWGAKPATIKITAISLCDSTAEYACPVWECQHT